nr:MAG TPA: hypothetical protein [Caudoviricetes sp.]
MLKTRQHIMRATKRKSHNTVNNQMQALHYCGEGMRK